MNEMASQIAQQMLDRYFIELEASGRHVHLTEQDALTLFGHRLTPRRDLSQPGQYLCQERVTLVGAKGEIANVAVLGPERRASQVELSMTDCVALGIQAPVRLSGDIANTPGITLRAGSQTVHLKQGVIVAKRHIHMTPEAAAAQGVKDKSVVKLRCLTTRPVIFDDVAVRVSADFQTRAHLDFDEANACGFAKGDLGMILHE